jgi:hypothetical protein
MYSRQWTIKMIALYIVSYDSLKPLGDFAMKDEWNYA